MKTFVPEGQSILKEAEQLTHGDRAQSYGHPFDNYTRVAGLVNILLKDKLATELTASDLALVMICVKLSREMNFPKRDNLVDIAGYVWARGRCLDEERAEYARITNELQAAGLIAPPSIMPADRSPDRELLVIPDFLRVDALKDENSG